MIPNVYPSLDFDLGHTADMLRDTVRDFATDKIAPLAAEIDKTNLFPRHLWPQMGALGLHGITVEEEFGGSGMGYLEHVVAMEEVSRASGAVGLVLWGAFQSLHQSDPPQWDAGAKAPLSAEADFRRACRRAGDERKRSGIGCRLHAIARGTARRSLHPQRHQDVDHQRSLRRNAGDLCQDRSQCRPARHHRLLDRKGLQGIQRRAETRQAGHARLRYGRTCLRQLRSAGRKCSGSRSAAA